MSVTLSVNKQASSVDANLDLCEHDSSLFIEAAPPKKYTGKDGRLLPNSRYYAYANGDASLPLSWFMRNVISSDPGAQAVQTIVTTMTTKVLSADSVSGLTVPIGDISVDINMRYPVAAGALSAADRLKFLTSAIWMWSGGAISGGVLEPTRLTNWMTGQIGK